MNSALRFRALFGLRAPALLTRWHDRCRAVESLEIYRVVLAELQQTLHGEMSDRGAVIRRGSLKVTEWREKREKFEREQRSIESRAAEINCTMAGPLNKALVIVKSLFASSPSLDDLEGQVRKLLNEADQLEDKADGVRRHEDQARARLTSVKDPVKDLEFAIERLQQARSECEERMALIDEDLRQAVVESCLCSSPEVFQLTQLAFAEQQRQALAALYFDIRETARLARRPQVELEAAVVEGKADLMKAAQIGFKNETLNVRGNVRLSGSGSHHRRVRSGKNSKWKRFDIDFDGQVSAAVGVSHAVWSAKPLAAGLLNSSLENFATGRETVQQQAAAEVAAARKKLAALSTAVLKMLTL